MKFQLNIRCWAGIHYGFSLDQLGLKLWSRYLEEQEFNSDPVSEYKGNPDEGRSISIEGCSRCYRARYIADGVRSKWTLPAFDLKDEGVGLNERNVVKRILQWEHAAKVLKESIDDSADWAAFLFPDGVSNLALHTAKLDGNSVTTPKLEVAALELSKGRGEKLRGLQISKIVI